MSIAPALRRLMPPVLERKAAGIYRAVFVDLRKLAACRSRQLPANGRLLDIVRDEGELDSLRLDFLTAGSTASSGGEMP